MTKYRKAADKDLVIIPGVGRVAPGQILEGEQYARFVKLGLLEEVAGDPAEVKKAEAEAKKAKAAAQKKAAKEAEIAEEKAEAESQAEQEAAEAEKAAARAAADTKAAARRDARTPVLPPDSGEAGSDADDTREVAAVDEDAAEAAVGSGAGDQGKTATTKEAKMEKRAAARRKKRTSKSK